MSYFKIVLMLILQITIVQPGRLVGVSLVRIVFFAVIKPIGSISYPSSEKQTIAQREKFSTFEVDQSEKISS
jgi:hypothetical protein